LFRTEDYRFIIKRGAFLIVQDRKIQSSDYRGGEGHNWKRGKYGIK